jgi:methyl-accepting chemotaxis protein
MTVDDKRREKARILAARAASQAALQSLQASVTEPGGVALLHEIDAALRAHDPQVDAFIALIDDNQTEQARDLALPQLAPLEQRALDALDRLVALQGREITSEGAQAQAAVSDMHAAMLGVSAAAAVLAAAIGLFTKRSVTRPLADAVAVARRVAAGDLTSTVCAAGDDEAGQLLRALDTMNGNLRHIVAKVRGGTDEMAGTSREIQADCAAILTRTENQARAIEASAASIEELTATVALNAGNADLANGEMGRTSAIAAEVGEVMGQVVGTMVAIRERSDRIGEIVAVIDAIAFQTNILALNAAVEAARAGAQGRGFAVVAGEVRSLAQRASDASREIRGLIQRSVATVEDGNHLVERASAMVQGMVGAAGGVASLVSEIAHASRQQHAGIEAFRRSIGELDRMAQQNAEFVGQVSTAADSLHRNMDALVGAVHVFKE